MAKYPHESQAYFLPSCTDCIYVVLGVIYDAKSGPDYPLGQMGRGPGPPQKGGPQLSIKQAQIMKTQGMLSLFSSF